MNLETPETLVISDSIVYKSNQMVLLYIYIPVGLKLHQETKYPDEAVMVLSYRCGNLANQTY